MLLKTPAPIYWLLLPYVLWVFFIWVAWAWLYPVITPLWVSKVFESEGVPSSRLILAFMVVVFTLCMESADRISVPMAEANLVFASSLLLYGVAKVAVSRFSPKPNVDPVDRDSENDSKAAGTT